MHPLFDTLVIGGGLSLVVCALVLCLPDSGLIGARVPYLILLSNSAHFAASTVRLYTKPGTYRSLPFLTLLFPLVSLGVLSLGVLYPAALGRNLFALYLTWSPYHYCAQAYGLAVMYGYRSGCMLGGLDKKLLWWVSMLPFLSVTLTADSDSGLAWFVPGWLWADPRVLTLRPVVSAAFFALSFAALVFLAVKVAKSKSGPLPLISLLLIFTNGMWFFVLQPRSAFVWATIFHGLQYLAIVAVFHWKDQATQPGNARGPLYHTVRFYLLCLALGYGLFNCLPQAYRLAGFGMVESVLVVAAAINVHHFIVDAYIWRLKKDTRNREIVEAGARELEPAAAVGSA